ncbi:hypothetical protein QIH01_04690 [Brevibacillus brevis]|nr:hypothetical protein QIH01_04690 [Brevibacillus brevis]
MSGIFESIETKFIIAQNYVISLFTGEHQKVFAGIVIVLISILILGLFISVVKRFTKALDVITKKNSKTMGIIKDNLNSFEQAKIIETKDFFLLPESFKKHFVINWRTFLRMGLWLLVPEDILKKYFEGLISLEGNCSVRQSELEMKIMKLTIVPKKLTSIAIQLKNVSSKKIILDMQEANGNQVISNDLKKHVDLTLNTQHTVLDDVIGKEIFSGGIIAPEEEKNIEFIFKSIDKATALDLKRIVLSWEIKIKRKRQRILLSTTMEIPKIEGTKIYDLLRKELDLAETYYFISLGGFLIFTVPISLFLCLIFALCKLEFMFLITLTGSLGLNYLSLNLNSKLAQLFWELLKEDERLFLKQKTGD